MTLIVGIADTKEVVIHYLIQIVLFHALEFLQRFLEFLLTLIEGKQGALLTFKDSLEELSLASEHLANLDTFLPPVLDIWRELLHGSFEGKPGMLRYEEAGDLCVSLFLFSHVSRQCENATDVFYVVTLSCHRIGTPSAHRQLVVSLKLLGLSIEHFLPLFEGA